MTALAILIVVIASPFIIWGLAMMAVGVMKVVAAMTVEILSNL